MSLITWTTKHINSELRLCLTTDSINNFYGYIIARYVPSLAAPSIISTYCPFPYSNSVINSYNFLCKDIPITHLFTVGRPSIFDFLKDKSSSIEPTKSNTFTMCVGLNEISTALIHYSNIYKYSYLLKRSEAPMFPIDLSSELSLYSFMGNDVFPAEVKRGAGTAVICSTENHELFVCYFSNTPKAFECDGFHQDDSILIEPNTLVESLLITIVYVNDKICLNNKNQTITKDKSYGDKPYIGTISNIGNAATTNAMYTYTGITSTHTLNA
jgi:hypothetical protein